MTPGLPPCPETVGIKLASLAAHLKEYLATGEAFDLEAAKGIIYDPEVGDYLGTLDSLALLPVPRRS